MTLLRMVDEHDEAERDWQLAMHDKKRGRASGVGLPVGAMTFHEFAMREAVNGS